VNPDDGWAPGLLRLGLRRAVYLRRARSQNGRGHNLVVLTRAGATTASAYHLRSDGARSGPRGRFCLLKGDCARSALSLGAQFQGQRRLVHSLWPFTYLSPLLGSRWLGPADCVRRQARLLFLLSHISAQPLTMDFRCLLPTVLLSTETLVTQS